MSCLQTSGCLCVMYQEFQVDFQKNSAIHQYTEPYFEGPMLCRIHFSRVSCNAPVLSVSSIPFLFGSLFRKCVLKHAVLEVKPL